MTNSWDPTGPYEPPRDEQATQAMPTSGQTAPWEISSGEGNGSGATRQESDVAAGYGSASYESPRYGSSAQEGAAFATPGGASPAAYIGDSAQPGFAPGQYGQGQYQQGQYGQGYGQPAYAPPQYGQGQYAPGYGQGPASPYGAPGFGPNMMLAPRDTSGAMTLLIVSVVLFFTCGGITVLGGIICGSMGLSSSRTQESIDSLVRKGWMWNAIGMVLGFVLFALYIGLVVWGASTA